MENIRRILAHLVFTNLLTRKCILLVFPLLPVSIFCLSSCRNEDASVTNPMYKSFVNPYDEVGKIHNEGLDYCLNYLKEHSGTVKSKDGLLLLANEGISKFNKEKNITISAEVYNKTMNFVKDYFSNSKTDKELKKITDNDLLSLGYSEKQTNYFNRLFSLFEASSSLEILKDSINYISFEALHNLTEADASPILAASSVMLNSLEYWYTHTDELYKIAELITGNKLNKIQREPIDWLEVGKVDAYALAGAAIPCIGATIGWAACAGGAALAASMLEATFQLIQYIIETYYGGDF